MLITDSDIISKYFNDNGVETIHFNTREDWLKTRKMYICGSDAASVIGIGFKTNIELFEDKTSSEIKDIEPNELMIKGSISEKYIRELYGIDHDCDVYDGTGILLVNTRDIVNGFPFMACTLDAICVDRNTGELSILEIKRSEYTIYEDEMPLKYRAQVLHQMYVTGIYNSILKARCIYGRREDGTIKVIEKEYPLSMYDDSAKYDMKILKDKEEEFFNRINEKKRPARILPSI